MDEVTRVERRRSRLREELSDAGVGLLLHGGMGERVLTELDYARYPRRHEREFPTYGALIVDAVASEWAPADLRISASEGCSLSGLRLLADGRQSFVLFTPEHSDLAVFVTAHDRETALVRLQRDTRHDLVIVQRTGHGLVRAYADHGVIVWDGTDWTARPYAESYTRGVIRSVPEAPRAVLAAILDFCIHAIGPAPEGAALVWALDEGGSDRLGHLRRPMPRVQLPALSLLDPLAHGALRQLLGQLDGATIIDRDGRLVEAGVHLTGSDRSAELVRPRPGRGTRHGSARRFSFDEARTVVFVISEDGPISVFSDGAVVASIEQASASDEIAMTPPTADESRAQSARQICDRCGKQLGVQASSMVAGDATFECPVCSTDQMSPWPGRLVHAWVIKTPGR